MFRVSRMGFQRDRESPVHWNSGIHGNTLTTQPPHWEKVLLLEHKFFFQKRKTLPETWEWEHRV